MDLYYLSDQSIRLVQFLTVQLGLMSLILRLVQLVRFLMDRWVQMNLYYQMDRLHHLDQ